MTPDICGATACADVIAPAIKPLENAAAAQRHKRAKAGLLQVRYEQKMKKTAGPNAP